MPGKAYEAGTIFLQVVPVFKDTMDQISAKAKDINKAMADEAEKGGADAGKRHSEAFGRETEKGAEKAGDQAGKKYAGQFLEQLRTQVRQAAKEIEPIKLRTDDEEAQAKLAALKKEMRSINRTKIKPDMDIDKLLRKVAAAQAAIDNMKDGRVDVDFNLNSMAARLKAITKMVESTKPKIDVDIDTDKVERALGAFERRAKAAAKSMSESLDKETSPAVARLKERLEKALSPDMDASKVRAEIAEVSRELKSMANDKDLDFVIRADAGEAYKTARAFNEYGHKIDGQHWDVTLDLNTRNAEKRLGAFETQVRKTLASAGNNIGDTQSIKLNELRRQLKELASVDITPDLDPSKIEGEAARIAAELAVLFKDKSLDVEVRVDAAAAYKDLFPLQAMLARLDGREVDIQVDADIGSALAKLGAVNGAMAATEAQSGALGGAVGLGANSFRSFNVVLLGAALLLPALIPMIAGVGGGLLALIPIFGSLGAGLGVLLVGFSGIGDALKAMSAVDKSAAKDSASAAKTMTGAARSVADAERNLARARASAAQANADAARQVGDAQRSAAKAVEDALARQADAERNLADAQRDAKKAQDDLRQARRAAQQELTDNANKRAQNALDERQGVIDVFNATTRNNAVQQDGSSTNLDKEQASIALAQAQLRLKEIREEQKQLAAQKKKTDAQGIKGTDVYQQAQDRVIAALERQKEAERQVGEAAQAVRDARVNGARAVADAVRSQQRSEAQGAQSVGDAQRNLVQAQQDYRAALVQTDEIGSAAMNNLEDAMSKLGPAGQHFARFLYGLRGYFKDLRDGIQSQLLPGVEDGLQAVINRYGPQFKAFAADMGGVMGRLFRQAGQGLGARPWTEFFATYAKLAPRLLNDFGNTTGNWMSFYAKLFAIVAPYSERFGRALKVISENSLKWIQSSKGTKAIQDFMDYAAKVGPEVADFFWQLARAFGNIGRALAPLGELLMNALTGLFKFIGDMDPKVLGFILGTIIALTIAFQVLVGVIAATFAGAIVAATPFTFLAFAVLAVVGALVAAYVQFDSVRNIINSVGGFVLKHKGTFLALAGAIGAVVLGMKAWFLIGKAIAAAQVLWTALQLGFNGALFAGAAATKGLTFAQKIFFALGKTIRAFTIVWTAVQWLWNAAFAANPLGAVVIALVLVVGGLIWAYKHFTWFKKAVDWVIHGVVAVFQWLWDVLFGHSIMPDIVDGMMWVGAQIKKIFHAIGVVIHVLADVFKWLWKNVIKPYLGFIIALWTAVFKAMAWVWKNILWPVLSLIGVVIWKLWKLSMKPTFELMRLGWRLLADAMKWVWKNIIKPIFTAFVDTFGPLVKKFRSMTDNMGSIWDGLKSKLAAPVRFVIDTVLNKGLIKAFNWVADKVGTKKMSYIPVPSFAEKKTPTNRGAGTGGGGTKIAMKTGGVLPGYTPGRDVHQFYSATGGRLDLSGGESIMRPEWTAAIGHGQVDYWNGIAATEGVQGIRRRMGMQAFKKGGVVWPVPGHQTGTYPGHDGVDINRGSGWDDYGDPIVSATSGVVQYVGTGRGYGQAIFVSSPYGTLVYGHTSATKVRAGQHLSPGTPIGNVGNTGNSSAPHLHFGNPGGTTAGALAILSGAGKFFGGSGASGISVPGWVSDIFGGPAKWLTGKMQDGLSGFSKRFGDSDFMRTMIEVPKKLIGGAADKIKDMASGFKAKISSVVGSIADFVTGNVSGSVRKQVKSVADKYGWGDGAQWDALDWVISHESGWDPNAANPSSSARGLFQKMTSLHGPIESTAAGQAAWGLNYIKDRYGNPKAAKAYWQSHGNYADGGVLPSNLGSAPSGGGLADNGTMMYDNGGYLPPGITQVVNLTGRPEPVFTADQFDRMGPGGAPGGPGVHYEPHFHKSDLTAHDVAFDLDIEFKRLNRQPVRYSGSRS